MALSCAAAMQNYAQPLTSVHTVINLLKNKHLILLGDSLTRYQYLDLVHLVTFQNYLEDSTTLNPVNEHTFSDWNLFYNVTNQNLAPYEKCDCFRDNNLHDERMEFENRYYFNPIHNISITYLMFTGRYDTLKGHWYDTGDFETYREPSDHFFPAFWTGSLFDKSDWLLTLSPYPTHILVMNVGHHPQKSFSDVALAKDTIRFLETKFSTVIWKTTSYAVGQDKPRAHDEAICAVSSTHCLDLSWTKNIDSSCYWDDKHFFAPVYNYINSQMIELLRTLYP